jgi:hypothetical protein
MKKDPEFGAFGKLYMMNFRIQELLLKIAGHKELMQLP